MDNGPRGNALAYLITFSSYGKWLPGQAGAIDRDRHAFGGPTMPESSALEQSNRASMAQSDRVLSEDARLVTLEAIREVCHHKGWCPIAIHVRSDHVHIVASAQCDPETMMVTFKRYASRALNRRTAETRKWWGRHGSTCYLWTREDVNAAVRYVVEGQGQLMACWMASA